MKQVFEIVVQWVRPLLAGVNVRLILKGLKAAYSLMQEIEKQHSEGDRQFTNDEKAAWVKSQIKEQTSLPDSVIDFVFGVAIARFVRNKRDAKLAQELPQ